MSEYTKGEVMALIAGPLKAEPEEILDYAIIVQTPCEGFCGQPHLKIIGADMTRIHLISLMIRTVSMLQTQIVEEHYGDQSDT